MIDIDVTFDFRTDTPEGRDPDLRSPTLRRYHQLLWSKRLPDGSAFELVTTTPGAYLHHRSALGKFVLSSDAAIPTFTRSVRLAPLLAQVSVSEREAFLHQSYTVGGMMVFPSKKVDRKMTINAARGCLPLIKDRFDLTVECIRRHYAGEGSPLSAVLQRYATFFDLFRDFRGYVEFFLLQDLVDGQCSRVHFFLPFEAFSRSPIPDTVDAYQTYRSNAAAFIERRNRRIERWVLEWGRHQQA